MSSEINEMLKQLLEGQRKISVEQQEIRQQYRKILQDNAELRNSLNVTPVSAVQPLTPVATSTPINSSSSIDDSTPSNHGRTSNVRRCVLPENKPSAPCRFSVRTVYKALVNNPSSNVKYDLSTSFLDPVNKGITDRLLKAVIAENDGKDNCPYSKADMKMAAKSYFRSLKEAANKAKKHRTEQHKRKARRQGRKRERKLRYLRGLKTVAWTEEAKKKIEDVIQNADVVSSDESEYDDDEENRTVIQYRAKKLRFLNSKFEKMKKDLYTSYVKSLPKALQSNFKPRIYAEGFFSSRTTPQDCPSWVLRE